MKSTPARRLLIIEGGSLLDEALKNLLSSRVTSQIVSVAQVDDTTLLETIRELGPDTIVVSEASSQDSARILRMLYDAPTLNVWRIIIVRHDDNRMDVYEKHCVVASKRDDLLELVRGDARRP